ncbi:LicD family protein [Arcticibacter tournemirensis]|nr:LicD family protein [Arcticibacter tournemirensis]
MIVEEGVKVTVTAEELLSEFSDEEDWEVFFPYDKISKEGRKKRNELGASRFNYFWGSYFYFMKKSGAQKMLVCDTITQPVDEELLIKSLSRQINTLYLETDWFEYDETKSLSYLERSQSIRNAIFNHQAWTVDTKKQAITIMHHLSLVAEEMGIDLFLHAGTLLGEVRHGKIMPWDDDIDLEIDSRDVDKFIQEIKKRGVVEHCTWIWGYTNQQYHKLWLKNGQKTNGFPYLFPFIDIWVFFEEENGEIRTCSGHSFQRKTYFPSREIKFEGCKLKLPNDCKGILDIKYRDWRTHIKVYTWSHRVKARIFKPLSLPIQVDETGRYKITSLAIIN